MLGKVNNIFWYFKFLQVCEEEDGKHLPEGEGGGDEQNYSATDGGAGQCWQDMHS